MNRKILIVTPDHSDGLIRGYHIIQDRLAKGFSLNNHIVDLVILDKSRSSGITSFNRFVRNVHFCKCGQLSRLFWTALGLLSGLPLQVAYYYNPFNRKFIKILCDKEKYDLIVFQLIRSTANGFSSFKNAKVLNMIDPHVISYRHKAISSSLIFKLFYAFESARLSRYQSRISSRFDSLALVSTHDVNICASEDREGNYINCPYGIDDYPGVIREYNQRLTRSIAFSGNFSYSPNIDSIINFFANVYPLIESFSDLNIYIFGNSSELLKKYIPDHLSNVKLLGRVDDVRSVLSTMHVSICAVQLPVGVQTKILESLSVGTPVITYDAGNFGIGAQDGKEIMVAKNNQDMADYILNIMSPPVWNRYSINGLDFIRSNFNWKKQVDEYIDKVIPQ